MAAPKNLPAINQRDVQILSDIRLMALSLQKITENAPNKGAVQSAIGRIIGDCERVIAAGPPEHRHIIERTASATAIEHELRRRTYGDDRP